jgi:hypothetical protein
VDDPLVVRGLEAARDLCRDLERLVQRQSGWMPRDPIRQRLAVDELHHQQVPSVDLFQPVNRRDVGMIERRKRPRLLREARRPVAVRDERVEHELEGDLAIEPGVPGEVHGPHAPFAEQAIDDVGAERGAGRQGHAGIIRALARACARRPARPKHLPKIRSRHPVRRADLMELSNACRLSDRAPA